MDPLPEHTPKQASYKEKAAIKWNVNDLLAWIEDKEPNLLDDDKSEKLRKAEISGKVFLACAGDREFFQNDCKLPPGPALMLANLSRELAEEEIAAASRQVFGDEVCRRTNTVKRLAEILDNEWVVHVRGTPSTGKTTLASLLRDYYEERGDRVVYVDYWRRQERNLPLAIYLASICEAAGYRGVNTGRFSHDNIVFILDEAQLSYSDHDLWQFIKLKNDQLFGPKLCLFAAYGSPSKGRLMHPLPTSFYLGHTKRVSIIRSHTKGSPDICLFYDEAEFEDVVGRYCAHPTHKLSLGRAARAYLFLITSGHPGAVSSMLSYISKVYGAQIKHGKIQQITEDDLIKALDDDTAVFSALESFPVQRSFPRQRCLTPPATRILSKLCQGSTIPYDHNDEGMELCITKGWIHMDVDDGIRGFEFCMLPSRLHQKYIEYFITSINPKPFPKDRFPSLPELCKAVFKCFSKKNLLLSPIERRPTILAAQPLEAQYQDEFYRAFTSLLGNGVGISSEWSRSNGGRVDFRILGPKWGVELLQNGTKKTLDEHYNRFLPNGNYHKWISDGLINDWLVIDCRCSTPKEYAPSRPNLWHAVFAEDYSTLRILGADKQEIMSEVCLMG